jgi:hypothetical protein
LKEERKEINRAGGFGDADRWSNFGLSVEETCERVGELAQSE